MRIFFAKALLAYILVVSPWTVGQEVRVNFELSDVVAVKGGMVFADDELVGSLLFVADAGGANGVAPMTAKIVKFVQKRKDSKPFGKLDRLLPIQDIEGLASDGDTTVFALGSHVPKDGDRRTDREFVVRATLDAGEGELQQPVVARNLLELMDAALRQAGVDLALTPTTVNPAVNLEGLTYGAGLLHVGFRAPLTADGKAILVSISAKGLFDSDASSVKVHLIDLHQRGIRGAACLAPDRVLVLAGSSGDEKATPAIYEFTPSTGAVRELYQFADTTKGHPEGIMMKDGQCLVVFDSDGTVAGTVQTVTLPGEH